jgi:hypothetical protein
MGNFTANSVSRLLRRFWNRFAKVSGGLCE